MIRSPRIFCCIAVLLLYIVGSWVASGCFFLLCAVLYYCCTTYCCTVVRGGWVGRFVGVSMGLCFSSLVFFPRYTGPALAYFGVLLVLLLSLPFDRACAACVHRKK